MNTIIEVTLSAIALTSPVWITHFIVASREYRPTRCHHNYTLDGRRKWRMYPTKEVKLEPFSPFVINRLH